MLLVCLWVAVEVVSYRQARRNKTLQVRGELGLIAKTWTAAWREKCAPAMAPKKPLLIAVVTRQIRPITLLLRNWYIPDQLELDS